jgi:hypothetical protein
VGNQFRLGPMTLAILVFTNLMKTSSTIKQFRSIDIFEKKQPLKSYKGCKSNFSLEELIETKSQIKRII